MPDLGDLMASVGPDGPKDARQALDAARQAGNPADVVMHLFAATAYLDQQVSLLERTAAGDEKAKAGVIARGRKKMLSVVGRKT